MQAQRSLAVRSSPVRAGAVVATRRQRTATRPTRGALQVVSYRSELTDFLTQRAHRYAEVTGLAGTMTAEEVTKALSPIIGNRTVNFIADGVVYKKDRKKDLRHLVDSLAKQHAAYEHLVYRPVVSAVNEEQGVVFSAVYFVLRNKAPVLGNDAPTDRISKGFLVDKMTFDTSTGQLVSSLATRQLTLEERDALLVDPSAWQPVEVEEQQLVAVPDIVAGPNDYKYMTEVVTKWTDVWSSGSSLDVLPQVLAPNTRGHDGYGLCNRPNGLLWSSLDEARQKVARTQELYDNRNELLSYAFSLEHKLAFQHWRANQRPKAPPEGGSSATAQQGPTEGPKEGTTKAAWSTSGMTETIEGISLICFNKHLQIEDVYKFDMMSYKNLKATS